MVLFGLAAATLLAGCKPPQSTDEVLFEADSGRKILAVDPEYPGPFKTLVKDGAEFLVARGEVGRYGGAFYENQIGAGPKTFNPWASFDATSTDMGEKLFAGLVRTDAYTGQPVPSMAREVEILPDNKTYIVTLREGLQWSDGHPITADDVVFTWNVILKNGFGNPSARGNLLVDGHFPDVRKLDDLTVEFKTYKPFAPFHAMLSQQIAPKHVIRPVLEAAGEDLKAQDKVFSAFWGTSAATDNPEKFVVSGMWQLDSYTPGRRVVFKRNPKFFMVDKAGNRLPYLDRYVINFVSDMNNVQLAFMQGGSDVYAVPGQFLSFVRKLPKPDFNIYDLGPSSGTTFITFNMNNRKDKDGNYNVDPVKAKWFRSLNFRKAVDWAINREDIINNILKGVGAPLFTAESLSSVYLNEKLADGHPQDLEAARQFLKDGGFSWDSQGRLLDGDGNRVEFDLITNAGNDQREAIGVNVKQDLEQLGMKVNFKTMDFNVLVGRIDKSDWEAIILGLTGSNLEPHGGANVWKSTGPLHIFNQREYRGKTPDEIDISDAFPWELKLDILFERGSQTLGFENRKPIYDRYQEIAYKQLPFIYLYSPISMIAVRDRVRNFDPTPLAPFHNMEEIWLETSATQ